KSSIVSPKAFLVPSFCATIAARDVRNIHPSRRDSDPRACCRPGVGGPVAAAIQRLALLPGPRGIAGDRVTAPRRGRRSRGPGAGKTTLARMAPPDVTVLTDEISYIRKQGTEYLAYGTPFAGELGRPGENASAPLAAWFMLVQGDENRLEPIGDQAEAVRSLMRNVLFFAEESEWTARIFHGICDFAARVPGYGL